MSDWIAYAYLFGALLHSNDLENSVSSPCIAFMLLLELYIIEIGIMSLLLIPMIIAILPTDFNASDIDNCIGG